MSKRPKLPKIDDDMRRWCVTLEEDLSSWEDVRTRPMFGLVAYYRGDTIFAAVPRTRAVGTERSILVKLPHARDRRLRPGNGPGAGWVTFEIESERDLPDALQRLAQAYERAR